MTNGTSSSFTASLRAGHPPAFWHSCRDHSGWEEDLPSLLLFHCPIALPILIWDHLADAVGLSSCVFCGWTIPLQLIPVCSLRDSLIIFWFICKNILQYELQVKLKAWVLIGNVKLDSCDCWIWVYFLTVSSWISLSNIWLFPGYRISWEISSCSITRWLLMQSWKSILIQW